MNGKYRNKASYYANRFRRCLVRGLLNDLVEWPPLPSPEDGYTLILGCNTKLIGMLPVNLEMLSRQEAPHLRRTLVVLDRVADQEDQRLEAELRDRFPNLRLELLNYNVQQARRAGRIGWAWVYSWLSWSLGIAQTRTRYALLHDFDAMLLRPNILEERYQAIQDRGDQYVGQRFYQGNGVLPEDGLLTTFELIFDAAFVRDRFRPIDLFNHVTTHRGRTVDFDTFLHAQAIAGTGSVLTIAEEDMVHPSQVICEFTELLNGRCPAPRIGSLMFIPYLMFASGDDGPLQQTKAALQAAEGPILPFFGRPLNLIHLDEDQALWQQKQARRLESALVGHVRLPVEDYFEAVLEHSRRRKLDGSHLFQKQASYT